MILAMNQTPHPLAPPPRIRGEGEPRSNSNTSPRVLFDGEPNFFLGNVRSVFVGLSLLFFMCLSTCVAAEDLPEGFQRIKGKYADVITDFPLDAEIRSLPTVFDAAVPRWCEEFDMDLKDVADWHVEAFVMLRRDEFKKAGFIPSKLPEFPYGFQFGNQVWVVEQPSPYYRRHLLLHEGRIGS